MLDFEPVRKKHLTLNQLAASLSVDDLRFLTNEMIDRMLALIVDCTDDDVTFQPVDPEAEDHYAANPEEANQAWTLGHVIVHATASSEESAFLAAEMARGVEHHGRSRAEVSWHNVKTIAQCRQRLEESRRMRLASLDIWPDEPNLDIAYATWEKAAPVNAKGRFVLGLRHDDAHLGQIAEIVRQSRTHQPPSGTLPESETSSSAPCDAPGCS